jgi:hypothetical protein
MLFIFLRYVLLSLLLLAILPGSNYCLGAVNNNNVSNNISIQTNSFNKTLDLKRFQAFTSLEENSIYTLRKDDLKYKTYLYFAFIFIFFILVYIKLSSPDYLEDLFTGFLKKGHLISGYSKQKSGIGINNILLDVLFLAIISIFFYELFWENFKISYLFIVYALLFFVLFQSGLVFISYRIFFGQQNFNVHLSNIFTFNRVLGIIVTPVMFIITYLDHDYKQIALRVLLLLLASFLIIRLYRIFLQIKNLLNYSFLYIFIYICVFEISLYFILIKVFFEKI